MAEFFNNSNDRSHRFETDTPEKRNHKIENRKIMSHLTKSNP